MFNAVLLIKIFNWDTSSIEIQCFIRDSFNQPLVIMGYLQVTSMEMMFAGSE